MLKLSTVMIGTSQADVMAAFYQKVFDKKADMADEGWSGWSVGQTFFMIGSHSEVKGQSKEPARIIINFETDEVKEEFERISKLGAKVIKEPYQMGDAWIATLADPDGNYFQLNTPWKN